MNEREIIGGNFPPDQIDDICSVYEDARGEAKNWMDGSKVETTEQMKSVDALREEIRQWRLELERGQKEATAPLREVYQAELDRWKPTIADAKKIEGCLVATVAPFKDKLAKEKEDAKRKAYAEAQAKEMAAREAARLADAADYEASFEADRLANEAQEAKRAAAAANKDTVKGRRTVNKYEITDHKAALHDIAVNDRDAVTAFIEEYVRRNHKTRGIDGVRVWQTREAY